MNQLGENMSDVKWFKITTGIFDNRKIKQIETMPDSDALLVIWFKLLALAAEVNEDGYLMLTPEVPYTEQLLANQFHKNISIIHMALEVFTQFRMIEIIDDCIYISNWEKYQNIEGLEKIKEQTRNRVAKYRERKRIECKNLGNVTCNVTVTECNATDIDKEIDNINAQKNLSECEQKKSKKEVNSQYSQDFETIYKQYPRHKGKAKAFAAYKLFVTTGKEISGQKYKFDNKQLWQAVVRFKHECEEKGTEEQYIPHFDTFMNGKILDYMETENE